MSFEAVLSIVPEMSDSKELGEWVDGGNCLDIYIYV